MIWKNQNSNLYNSNSNYNFTINFYGNEYNLMSISFAYSAAESPNSISNNKVVVKFNFLSDENEEIHGFGE